MTNYILNSIEYRVMVNRWKLGLSYLKLIVGPGDQGETAITEMMPRYLTGSLLLLVGPLTAAVVHAQDSRLSDFIGNWSSKTLYSSVEVPLNLNRNGENMPLLIGDNLVVSMHYKLTDNDGKVIDSSEGGEPLTYLHGTGSIISGLEKELVGKVEGDSLQVKVEPDEGYGDVNPELVQVVEKAAFQGVESIEAGMTFQAKDPDGSVQQILVRSVEGDEVTIDANHPLAGITLNFEVEIVSVREASEEEIDHGHAH